MFLINLKKWLMNKENIFLFSIGYNKVFSQLTFFFKIFDGKTFRYANNSWTDSVIWNQNVSSENSQNLELLIHSLKFSIFVLINTFLIQIEPLYFIVTMFSIFDYFVKCYFGLGWNLAKLHDFVDKILVSILSKLN